MDKFGKSQSVKRVEDVRFLTGQGRYIDDIVPEPLGGAHRDPDTMARNLRQALAAALVEVSQPSTAELLDTITESEVKDAIEALPEQYRDAAVQGIRDLLGVAKGAPIPPGP